MPRFDEKREQCGSEKRRVMVCEQSVVGHLVQVWGNT